MSKLNRTGQSVALFPYQPTDMLRDVNDEIPFGVQALVQGFPVGARRRLCSELFSAQGFPS